MFQRPSWHQKDVIFCKECVGKGVEGLIMVTTDQGKFGHTVSEEGGKGHL